MYYSCLGEFFNAGFTLRLQKSFVDYETSPSAQGWVDKDFFSFLSELFPWTFLPLLSAASTAGGAAETLGKLESTSSGCQYSGE